MPDAVGARNWTLQRNLQKPMRWTETFRTPTWTDYLRLNHRLTEVDKELDERVFQLHAGERAPERWTSGEPPGFDGQRRKCAADWLAVPKYPVSVLEKGEDQFRAAGGTSASRKWTS
jgi:hypothetical protein